jgi:carbon storage regulator
VLALTRYNYQTIMIGNDVVVTVLGVHGDKVTIGIDKPKDVLVHREEVFDRILHLYPRCYGGKGEFEKTASQCCTD